MENYFQKAILASEEYTWTETNILNLKTPLLNSLVFINRDLIQPMANDHCFALYFLVDVSEFTDLK